MATKRPIPNDNRFSTSDRWSLFFAEGLTFATLAGKPVTLDGGLVIHAPAVEGKKQYIVPMDGTFMDLEAPPAISGYFTRYSRIKGELTGEQLEVPARGPQSKKLREAAKPRTRKK